MKRRTLLRTMTGALMSASMTDADAAAQMQPVKLGVDTYSLRAFKWNVSQMLDFAESHKLDAIQASLVDFESLESPYLRGLKEKAERLGIQLEPGFGCICPLSKGYNAKRQGEPSKYLQQAIRTSQTLGAKSCRVFVGGAGDRAVRASIAALMESSIQLLRGVKSQAVDAGVKLAIENHGDMQARQVRTIIEEAGKDFVASCLDTGNPVMVAEDPLVSLEVLAPYVVTTHIRDSVVFPHPRGAYAQWVALGDGTVDYKQLTARYRELCPSAPMQLEIITGRPPTVVPYLDAEFWKGLPDVPASELARYTALAAKGRPHLGVMIVADAGVDVPPAYRDALKEQQRWDLVRSIEYAKKTLGVGVRWRS
jgi:sugar phosphate isomerase/epimerase